MGYRAWRGPAGSLAGLEGYLGASRITQAHDRAHATLALGTAAGTPYVADATVTDQDFDARILMRVASYTPTARQILMGQGASGTGWYFSLETNGTIRLAFFTGTDYYISSSGTPADAAAAGEWVWVRVTRASGTFNWFVATPENAEADSWTSIRTAVTSISAAIVEHTTGGLGIRSASSSGTVSGSGTSVDVARALLYRGATLVQDFDPGRSINGASPGLFDALTPRRPWQFRGDRSHAVKNSSYSHTPTTLYVATTGGDTNAGTIGSPLDSLATAAWVAYPGDTVLMRGGYYDQMGVNVGITAWFTGTAENRITIKSYTGEWAILDGINDPLHPRTFEDGKGDGTIGLVAYGSYVTWEDFEVRNAVNRGINAVGIHHVWRNVVVRNGTNVGFYAVLDSSLLEECLFRDNYGIENGGNTGNGMGFITGSSLTDNFDGALGENNIARRCIASGNSDDGMTPSWSKNQTFEYNVILDNGRGTTGNGMGLKLGLTGTVDTGNIARYNLSFNNRANGFDTNTSQGVLVHNNTAWNNGAYGFVLTAHSLPSSSKCENTAKNNISHSDASGARIVGPRDSEPTECIAGPTVHTHNLGHSTAWADGLHGADNLGADPLFVSVDPANANFLKLGVGSPAIDAGTVVHQASDVDLGAIPYGEDFADGWDWQALLAAHPTPTPEAWPMPQPA